MDILQAARQLVPGTSWNLKDGQLVQAEDGTPRVSPPTQEALQILIDATAYQDRRRLAYPSVGDQLDAIWKILNGTTDAESVSVREKILAVKVNHPKP